MDTAPGRNRPQRTWLVQVSRLTAQRRLDTWRIDRSHQRTSPYDPSTPPDTYRARNHPGHCRYRLGRAVMTIAHRDVRHECLKLVSEHRRRT